MKAQGPDAVAEREKFVLKKRALTSKHTFSQELPIAEGLFWAAMSDRLDYTPIITIIARPRSIERSQHLTESVPKWTFREVAPP